MRKIRSYTHSVVMMALIFAGSTVSVARARDVQSAEQPWRLAGVITAIDRAERSLVVRETSTGRTVVVVVDNGSGIRLRDGFLLSYPRTIPFEMALVGMHVDLRVSRSNRSLGG